MINPYPKPRWDLENDVVHLEEMITVYEKEIEVLKKEKQELRDEVYILKRKLEFLTVSPKEQKGA